MSKRNADFLSPGMVARDQLLRACLHNVVQNYKKDPAPVLSCQINVGGTVNNSPSIELKPARKENGNAHKPGPSNQPCKVKRNRVYEPKVGTGAYAILTTMLDEHGKQHSVGCMTRQDILRKSNLVREHSEQCLKTNESSGWTAMNTLLDKGLVISNTIGQSPSHYKLTSDGVKLATRILQKTLRKTDSDGSDNPKKKATLTKWMVPAKKTESGLKKNCILRH